MDTAYLKRLHQQCRPANFRPRATSWYEIRNLADSRAEIALYDEIGAWGVSASAFVDELRALNASSITLRISSPGGDVHDGLLMLNALRQHPADIDVVIEGLAASAASFIAMAGDTVMIAPQAMVMIHDAAGLCMGNAEDMFEMANLLDKHSDNIAAIYSQKAGGTVEDWRAKMREETWYTDQEAVDAGLADGVLGEDAPVPPEKRPPAKEPDEGSEEETEESGEDEPAKPGKKAVPPEATAKKAPTSEPSVVMPTTNPLAAWDFNAISESIRSAVKEAIPHG